MSLCGRRKGQGLKEGSCGIHLQMAQAPHGKPAAQEPVSLNREWGRNRGAARWSPDLTGALWGSPGRLPYEVISSISFSYPFTTASTTVRPATCLLWELICLVFGVISYGIVNFYTVLHTEEKNILHDLGYWSVILFFVVFSDHFICVFGPPKMLNA